MSTCQICGRPIKSKNGVIAHHGYKRPGWGFQTASCEGARYEPYEVSRDRIPMVVTMWRNMLVQRQQWLHTLRTDPPTLTAQRYIGGGRHEPMTVEKPADFDPATARRDYRMYSYRTLWFDRIAECEREIKAIEADIAILEKRFEDWSPVPQPA